MISKVFAIFDTKVAAYLPPFMMKTIGEAERTLDALINDPEHNFCKHAEDFILFELGSWSDDDASYNLYDAPHSISQFIAYRKPGVGESTSS